jgi:uncharacterized protein
MDDPNRPVDGPSSDERTWAMAMHVGTLVAVLAGGWGLHLLVPLLAYLWKRDDAFFADHAREQLNFQLSLTIYAIVATIGAVLTLGIGLLVLIPVAIVVALVALFTIIAAAIAANQGRPYRFPLTIRMVT